MVLGEKHGTNYLPCTMFLPVLLALKSSYSFASFPSNFIFNKLKYPIPQF